MVVRSLEAYKRNLFESEVFLKLKEAEYQASSMKKRFSHDETIVELKKVISEKNTGRKN